MKDIQKEEYDLRELKRKDVSSRNDIYTEDMTSEDVRNETEVRDSREEEAFAEVNRFEDLMELVGTGGRWNITIIILSTLCSFVSPFQLISYQFLGATPDHWCHIAPLVEANWTHQQILDFAIPHSSKDNTTEQRASCLMYDHNYTLAAHLGYHQTMNNLHLFSNGQADTVACKSRDFNHSQYESTVVTQWDLVCERRALYSTTQAVTQIGKLVGSFIFGFVIETLGRRTSVLLSGALTMVTGFLISLSPSITFYIVMRGVITAVASGYYMGCLILSLEISSPKQRTYVGAFMSAPWALGYMILPGIAYLIRPWQWLQTAFTFPTFLFIIYICMLPESPRWLMTQGRHTEALRILTWAAAVNGNKLPPDTVVLAAMKKITEVSIWSSPGVTILSFPHEFPTVTAFPGEYLLSDAHCNN
ncbi:solute carrier family 22 member 3 [Cherax quadricarinatus]|uniref:solute carrier family 22 member 3 n=1 Tax=Cherax quadricarinatus TaxID=27406 RepID=UPI00387E96D9